MCPDEPNHCLYIPRVVVRVERVIGVRISLLVLKVSKYPIKICLGDTFDTYDTKRVRKHLLFWPQLKLEGGSTSSSKMDWSGK
jgi:hypothetical protein